MIRHEGLLFADFKLLLLAGRGCILEGGTAVNCVKWVLKIHGDY
jgi:hypothetical protein